MIFHSFFECLPEGNFISHSYRVPSRTILDQRNDPDPFDFVRTWKITTLNLMFMITIVPEFLNVMLVNPCKSHILGHIWSPKSPLDPSFRSFRHLWMSKNFLKINGSRQAQLKVIFHGFCMRIRRPNVHPSNILWMGQRNPAPVDRW